MATNQWWKESVIYQIYPRSFMDSNGDGIGDLNGILSKLDYLQDLGIDVIWMSPIYQSPNDDNGYDISDYRSILAEFGTMEEFEKLLSSAHQRGIKIVMDLVVNHTSDEHPWFIESRKSKDNPYRDYYFWREPKNGKEPNNWGSWFSGSAWEWDEATGMYYLHMFSRKQPDLNWDNPKVRDSVFDMMDWWCQKGIDGFRMDVISMISKVPGLPDGKIRDGAQYGNANPYILHGPHVHEYLKEMYQRVLSKYDLMTVGETAGVTVEDAKKYAGFDSQELNMVFQFEHMGMDKNYKLTELKQILTKWQNGLEGSAWNSLYWQNHDQPRIISRFCQDENYREIAAKMIATCLHMQQGTPYIYQGEELGMTNTVFHSLDDCRDIEVLNRYHEEVEKHKSLSYEALMEDVNQFSRDHSRTPMQWDDSPNAGFTTGTPWIAVNPNYTRINAKEQTQNENSIFHYYKKLIKLRKKYPVILDGHYELLEPDSETLYCFTRESLSEKLLVVCNFRQIDKVVFSTPSDFLDGSAQLLLSNYDCPPLEKEMLLRPFEARIYYIKK